MTQIAEISLLIADIDGTLVTPDKELTEEAIRAVRDLRAAGIEFAITSGRPPRGMRMFFEPLELTVPIAAFNGGLYAKTDLKPILEHNVDPAIAADVVDHMCGDDLEVWLYNGGDWFVTNPHAPHVKREEETVRFKPIVVDSFDGRLQGTVKLVGVSDDHQGVIESESELQKRLKGTVAASRSQPYYLDVTNPMATKGRVVHELSKMLDIPRERIATIGDGPNDVAMFKESGLSIAMGNASPEVQAAADHVTDSNENEGFAKAVRRYLLGQSV